MIFSVWQRSRSAKERAARSALTHSGSSFANEPTFKRLLLVGTQLCFMDRPSVMFGDVGTIGRPSPYRLFSTAGEPVTSVFEPPSGPGGPLYHSYIEADLASAEFASVVDGLVKSDDFAEKFIQPEGR